MASPAVAQSAWVEVGRYQNERDTRYSTTLLARLMSSEWDPLRESKVSLIFQINLQGKDVGAMEFDALCRIGYFTLERKIIGANIWCSLLLKWSRTVFSKVKMVARDMFLCPLSASSDSPELFGRHPFIASSVIEQTI